jgi:hypothetical protein
MLGMRVWRTFFVTLMVLVLPVAAKAGATLFQDDFSSGSLDAAKWTADTNGSCSVDVSGGKLVATFTGANDPRHAFAVSETIHLPAGWTSVNLTGDWLFAVPNLGECQMALYDAADPSKYVSATYYCWPSKGFRASTSGLPDQSQARGSFPGVLTPFDLTFTPINWTFTTEGGSISTDIATTLFAGTSDIYFKIGGWEYSAVTNVAHYDNIVLTPEPATLSLLGLGALGALASRKRK